MGAKFSDEKKSNGEDKESLIEILEKSGLIIPKKLEKKLRTCSQDELFSMKICLTQKRRKNNIIEYILTVKQWIRMIKVQKNNKIGFEYNNNIIYFEKKDFMLLV